MKKIKKTTLLLLCLVLTAALLAGCGKDYAASTVPETAAPTAEPTVPPETTAPFIDSAAYTVERQDESLRDDAGAALIRLYYDQVVLTEDTPQAESINRLIAQDCDEFFFENPPEAFQEYLQLPELSVEYPYFNTVDAEVTNNAGGLFSIRLDRAWYMGGVFNLDYWGLNYDLNTGKAVALSELSDLTEAEFTQQLKTIVWDYLTENYGEGLFSNAEQVLESYTLEAFDFFIQDGEIILTFPTYTFSSGAAGATVVPTGLRVTD